MLVPQTGVEPATSLSLEQMRLPSILRHWGIAWSEGSDSNRRFYSFADCCIGPLCHPHIILENLY